MLEQVYAIASAYLLDMEMGRVCDQSLLTSARLTPPVCNLTAPQVEHGHVEKNQLLLTPLSSPGYTQARIQQNGIQERFA